MDGRKRYENDTKTVSVDGNRFENGAKTVPFSFENGVVWTGSNLHVLKLQNSRIELFTLFLTAEKWPCVCIPT